MCKQGLKPSNYGNRAIITDRNEVVAKVMFLLVSVILSTGGVSLHTVNERPVRILLECILLDISSELSSLIG